MLIKRYKALEIIVYIETKNISTKLIRKAIKKNIKRQR